MAKDSMSQEENARKNNLMCNVNDTSIEELEKYLKLDDSNEEDVKAEHKEKLEEDSRKSDNLSEDEIIIEGEKDNKIRKRIT